MRAREFITEAPGIEPIQFDKDHANQSLHEIADRIRSECAPFLKNNLTALRQGLYLYRGIHFQPTFVGEEMTDAVIKGTVRTDRKPRDSAGALHKALDKYFQRDFGFPYRSAAMFATMGETAAREFGAPYIVFPTGNYTMCFSPKVVDITTGLGSNRDFPAIKSVLRNMSDSDIVSVGEQYGFGWQYRTDLIRSFYRPLSGLISPQFEKFFVEYFLPRLGYEETQSVEDLGESEAMVRCSGYYGINYTENSKSMNAALLSLILE